jgi:hypothetical protein
MAMTAQEKSVADIGLYDAPSTGAPIRHAGAELAAFMEK